MKTIASFAAIASIAILSSFASPSFAAVDESAAKALAKRNDCFKCHAVDKTKKGPSYQKIAAKFKGKPDADAKILENLTKEPMVKLDDGTEEKHRRIDTDNKAEIQNLIEWIKSR